MRDYLIATLTKITKAMVNEFEVNVIKKYLDFKHYYDSYNEYLIKRLAEEG